MAAGQLAGRAHKFVLCPQDRLFPTAFLRRVAHDRLGMTPDELDSGHCAALSQPQQLVELLCR